MVMHSGMGAMSSDDSCTVCKNYRLRGEDVVNKIKHRGCKSIY